MTINTTSSLYVGECDLTRVILPVLNTSREDKAVQHPARAAPPTKLEGLKVRVCPRKLLVASAARPRPALHAAWPDLSRLPPASRAPTLARPTSPAA